MAEFRTMMMFHPLKTRGNISYEVSKVTRIWNFLKTCDIGDLALIVDSKLLKPIILDYVYVAVKRVLERGSIQDYHAAVVYDEMKFLLTKPDMKKVMDMANEYKANG